MYGNIFECVFRHIFLDYEGTTVTRKKILEVQILGSQSLPLYSHCFELLKKTTVIIRTLGRGVDSFLNPGGGTGRQ